jgi:predicted anti-sigma-YlaC factor YlaD
VATENRTADISCLEVIRELSNYLDGDVDAKLRDRIVDHLRECSHCTAIHDGMGNIVRLMSDDRVVEVPDGFGKRLYARFFSEIQ